MRGDPIRILGQLLKRRDRLDYFMIATTGLADPGPVVQTILVDEDLKERLLLDAIVIDALHIEKHLDEIEAAAEQVAFLGACYELGEPNSIAADGGTKTRCVPSKFA